MKFKLVLRYAAFCAATQEPPFDTPHFVRLLRDRLAIRRAKRGYSGTGGRGLSRPPKGPYRSPALARPVGPRCVPWHFLMQ
ncbi:MAG: hypothetical protein N2050_03640 [Flavobacteriales bacterium]|nr:hypothetical protein [Flavobacteriales bacterium]